MSEKEVWYVTTAAHAKPGQRVRFQFRGFTVEGTLDRVERSPIAPSRTRFWTKRSESEEFISIEGTDTISVLEEAQPEEPTAFGACVVAAGRKYVRADNSNDIPWTQATTNGYDWFDWKDICATGHVIVINSDPFNHGD